MSYLRSVNVSNDRFFDRKLVVYYKCMLNKQIHPTELGEGISLRKLSDNQRPL